MLIGYSCTPDKPKCLVYEFLQNGSLEDALEIGVCASSVQCIGCLYNFDRGITAVYEYRYIVVLICLYTIVVV